MSEQNQSIVASNAPLFQVGQASDPEDATCGKIIEISWITSPEVEAQHVSSPGCPSEFSLRLDNNTHRESTLHSDLASEDDSADNDEPLQIKPKSGQMKATGRQTITAIRHKICQHRNTFGF